MQTVAAGWLIFDLTGSAGAVGVLTFLSRGPGMVLSAYGGELADRYDRRKLVILLYICQAVPAALLALVAWEDISRVTEVYAASFLIGVAGALASPTLQQLVVATVPAELAKRATGLGSVSYNTARLIGPAVGGGLVAAIGPGPCFAINALSYFAVIFMVATAASPGTAPICSASCSRRSRPADSPATWSGPGSIAAGSPPRRRSRARCWSAQRLCCLWRRLRTTSSSSPPWSPGGAPGTCSRSTASGACSSPTPGGRYY